MAKYALIFIFLGYTSVLMAQKLTGTITDKETREPLISATVGIVSDEGKKQFTTTDINGYYELNNISPGKYKLQISYIGYKSLNKSIHITNDSKKMDIILEENAQILEEVAVQGRATRAEQKGDSLSYNAEAFKVLKGSTAEDLLSKMPGIVVEGGNVQAQGEDVKKVLVDGKEFFEGDINLALKNLPADVIANIEVFDKKSEQAEFTGFDDGEDIKTINIVTKKGFQQSTFGEVYSGYGTDNRYKAGGNINLFNKDLRVSILGMSNNINQQNFSQEDLAGVMASSQSSKRGNRGGGMPGGFGNQSENFMVGNLGGVTSSNGLGVNYVDQWNEKMKFTGSYFFNQSDNLSQTEVNRQYFDSSLPGMSYNEYNESQMKNWNHRFNMKFDYQINDRNSLQIKPSLSFQNNDMTGFLSGMNLQNMNTENEISNNSRSTTDAYNLGMDMIYRHKFPVEGRTLSLNINGKMSNNEGETYNEYIEKIYTGGNINTLEYGQLNDKNNQQYSVRGNLTYTEKITDRIQLQTNYKVSYANTESDKKVYDRSTITDLYDQLNEGLSNEYQSGYLTQAGGAGLRYNKEGLNMMAGVDFQYASLDGKQIYPWDENINKNYFSVLPSFMMRYSINRSNSLMLRYRSNSISPSINELQQVIDNTNPLFMSTGNPDLDQQINHSLNLRYIHTNALGQTFIAMLGGTYRDNYISDSTFVASEDIELPSGIVLNKGAQFTKPVNMDGYYSLQSMLTYGFPIDFIKSNLNLSFSVNYANVPTIFNGQSSKTQELNMIPKMIIGSNISDKLDFTLSYSAGFNKFFNSSTGSISNDYTNHTANMKFGWTFWKGFTLGSNFSYINYAGLDSGNTDYYLWNASLSKKFLKYDQAEIKLEAFDLLKQNQAFVHQTGSNYYDYINSNVLQPYFMLSFKYTIR